MLLELISISTIIVGAYITVSILTMPYRKLKSFDPIYELSYNKPNLTELFHVNCTDKTNDTNNINQSTNVYETIENFKECFTDLYEFAESKMIKVGSNVPSHGMSHINRVLTYVWLFAHDFNSRILRYAYAVAILHDVFDHKYINDIQIDEIRKDTYNTLLFIQNNGKFLFNSTECMLIIYAAMGVSWSKSVKRNFKNLFTNSIDDINKLISEFSYHYPKEVINGIYISELIPDFANVMDIVHDADWTDASNIRRCLDYYTEKHPEATDIECANHVLAHWNDKISNIYTRCTTPYARCINEIKYYQNMTIIEELVDELGLDVNIPNYSTNIVSGITYDCGEDTNEDNENDEDEHEDKNENDEDENNENNEDNEDNEDENDENENFISSNMSIEQHIQIIACYTNDAIRKSSKYMMTQLDNLDQYSKKLIDYYLIKEHDVNDKNDEQNEQNEQSDSVNISETPLTEEIANKTKTEVDTIREEVDNIKEEVKQIKEEVNSLNHVNNINDRLKEELNDYVHIN